MKFLEQAVKEAGETIAEVIKQKIKEKQIEIKNKKEKGFNNWKARPFATIRKLQIFIVFLTNAFYKGYVMSYKENQQNDEYNNAPKAERA